MNCNTAIETKAKQAIVKQPLNHKPQHHKKMIVEGAKLRDMADVHIQISMDEQQGNLIKLTVIKGKEEYYRGSQNVKMDIFGNIVFDLRLEGVTFDKTKKYTKEDIVSGALLLGGSTRILIENLGHEINQKIVVYPTIVDKEKNELLAANFSKRPIIIEHGAMFFQLSDNTRYPMIQYALSNQQKIAIEEKYGSVLIGNEKDNHIRGSKTHDVIYTNKGINMVFAKGGNDTIYGGDHADLLYGDMGYDVIYGGGGDDAIYGGWQKDRLFGEEGNDRIEGNAGDDKMNGGTGHDYMMGGTGRDNMRGGDGNDIMLGGRDDDKMYGEKGVDRLDGGDGDDVMHGGPDNDSLRGHKGYDSLYGGHGHDTLSGGAGDDILFGDAGDDIIRDHDGYNKINGGLGDDFIFVKNGDNVIDGGEGNDRIITQKSHSLIIASSGNDVLEFKKAKFKQNEEVKEYKRHILIPHDLKNAHILVKNFDLERDCFYVQKMHDKTIEDLRQDWKNYAQNIEIVKAMNFHGREYRHLVRLTLSNNNAVYFRRQKDLPMNKQATRFHIGRMNIMVTQKTRKDIDAVSMIYSTDGFNDILVGKSLFAKKY